MKNMKLIALFFGAFLFLGDLNAQSTSNAAPSDAVVGFTYDFDLAKKLIIDHQLKPTSETAIAKPIVESKNFPKLIGKSELNNDYYEKLQAWMEKNPNVIIESLKSRKEIVHPFGNN
jgi:hypothetical protein